MKVENIAKKEKNIIYAEVVVTAEEFEAAIQKAYNNAKGQISIPGFRKGKAPRAMIERMYGAGVFYQDAIEILYPDAVDKACAEAQADLISNPEVDFSEVTKEGFTFKFTMPVKPEVTLGTYKGVKAVMPEASVSDAEVEAQIAAVRQRNARVEAVEREAKLGDTAVIDFEGFVDGVAFEGGKGEDYALELGSGSFIPGFEEQLVGTKAGDAVDVNVTFPEEYHAEDLKGKPAVFKVTVKEVKESILPELDDEFAKDVSEFDTFEEYKNSIKKRLEEDAEAKANAEFSENVYDAIINEMTVEIPEVMINNRVDAMVNDFERRLKAQYGMELNSYLGIMGITLAELKKDYKPQAERSVKISLMLETVAKLENIEVTDEDIEKEYADMASMYNMKVEDLKNAISVEDLKTDLYTLKASRLVVDNAVPAKETKKTTKKKTAAKSETEDKTEEKPKAKKSTTAKKSTAKSTENAETKTETKSTAKKTTAAKTTKTTKSTKKTEASEDK